jgi:hypothetical protein
MQAVAAVAAHRSCMQAVAAVTHKLSWPVTVSQLLRLALNVDATYAGVEPLGCPAFSC